MSFQDVIAHIKRSIVGLGLLADPQDPLSVVIRGTGFVVHPDGWIMTNRHVAELFLGERDGQFGVRNSIARAVIFVDVLRELPGGPEEKVPHHGALPCAIVEVAMPPGGQETDDLHYNQVPDLAVCRIEIPPLGYIKQLPFIKLGDSSKVREGDEVAICGFPSGLALHHDFPLRQATPIAQKGIIAAILPWSGLPNPHAFQLDIQVNPGSSGSPVFVPESGEVVGVVFAARVRPETVRVPGSKGEEEVATVTLPTGLGYAVPSNRYREQPKPVTQLPDVYHR